VIRALQEAGCQVIAATSGRSFQFLKKECPEITIIEFQGISVQYPRNDRIALKLIRSAPLFLAAIWWEHQVLKKLARELKPDLIISDNRYGCWHAKIPSVFITHQLAIQPPVFLKWLSKPLNAINYWFIGKYSECWIPDFEPHKGLAGALSHPVHLPANAIYIGILSRFSDYPDLLNDDKELILDVVVMLSGPEPQRTILEKKISEDIKKINIRVVLVQGKTEVNDSRDLNDRFHVFSHLGSEKLVKLIRHSELVICRSGYSSIMDIVTLGKRAIFIPTPGQTEQEYLSRYLMDKKIFFSLDQNKFDLVYALEMSKNFPGMVIRNDYTQLKGRIRELLNLRFSSRQVN
jgi:uncharacterized protein (TIGR00661 family)